VNSVIFGEDICKCLESDVETEYNFVHMSRDDDGNAHSCRRIEMVTYKMSSSSICQSQSATNLKGHEIYL
jgi:hypothetical protein